MEDTMMTVKQYEVARVEYDAYRTDLEVKKNKRNTYTIKSKINISDILITPQYYRDTAARVPASAAKLADTEASFLVKRAEFEKLRSDVQIKLKFLDENRVKVIADWLPPVT